MNEEEKKAIEHFKAINGFLYGRYLKALLNLIEKQQQKIEKQQKENKKLKEIIIAIRHELKGNVIVKEENGYAPAKNLTKQEVYESYVKLNLLLKANYIFKEDVIKELLEE